MSVLYLFNFFKERDGEEKRYRNDSASDQIN